MEKKRTLLGIFLFILAIVAVMHSTFYLLANYGTSLKSPGLSSFSGLVVSKTDSSGLLSLSEIFMILEWAVVILGTIFFIMKQKLELKKEIISLYVTKKYYSPGKQQTDIDILYEILQEKKHLKIAAISNVFHVEKETAMQWAKTLENGNLASIYYPQFGEPEVLLNNE